MLSAMNSQFEHSFEYEIHFVADRKYGHLDESTGEWNGMVGELLRGDADVVLANLAVTTSRSSWDSEREGGLVVGRVS